MSRESRIKSPFPGLRPFNTDESRIFFGRDGLSDMLLEKLHAARFVAVVGTSGSGKSSLVRAGLLPALRGGFMRDAGSRWRLALFRPGDDPIGTLARALAEAGLSAGAEAGGARGVERALRRNSLGLVAAVRASGLPPAENLLIVVDQFEELYRFSPGASAATPSDEASAFVRLLLEATQQTDLAVYVILTMRSDYMGETAHFWGLPEAINRGQFLIPRMDDDERREAVEGPVKVFGARISAPLVNRLLNDAGDDPRQLPRLQHALMRTWDYWLAHRKDESEPLGVEHYKAVGGMARALSLNADEAYEELDERQKWIAERMLKRLTEREAGEREGRLPATFGELQEITEAGADELAAVVETFRKEGRSFLMPPAPWPLEAKTVIDISHESLISGWDRLGEWVKAEAKSAETYRRVADAATRHAREEAGPLRDPDLKFALEWRERERPNAAWAQRYDPNFDLTMSFLDESRAQREREEASRKQEAEHKREEERALAAARVAEAVAQQRYAEAEQRRAAAEAAAAEEARENAARLLTEQQKVSEAERARAEVQTRYAEANARSAKRLRWLAFALALVSLLATGFGLFALSKSAQARLAEAKAVEARAAADTARGAAVENEQEALVARQEADQRSEDLKDALGREQQALADKERQRIEAERLKVEAVTQAQKAELARQTAEGEKKKTIDANQKEIKNREALNAFLRGELSAAETHFKELSDLYGSNPAGQAWVHYNLGVILRKRGNYTGAAEEYVQALDILKQSLKEQYSNRSSSEKQSKRGLMAYHYGLAQVEAELGEHDKAKGNYQAVLDIARDEPRGADDRVIRLEVWSYLADLYRDKVIAADTNIQAIESEKSRPSSPTAPGAPAVSGLEAPAGGKRPEDDLADLARVLERDKKLREFQQTRYCQFLQARAYFDNVLQDQEAELSPDSPLLAVSYGWLAEVNPPSDRTNELAQLSRRIKEAGAASRAKAPNEHERYRALAQQYLSLRKYFHAVWAQERGVSPGGAPGEAPAQHHLTLARAYRGAAKFKDVKRPDFIARVNYASSFYEGARAHYEAAFRILEGKGVDIVELVGLSKELANFYVENGRYDEAERTYLRLQWDKMKESAKVDLSRQLAEVYRKNGKYDEAERIYLGLLGPPDSEGRRAQDVSRLLATLYRERRNYAEAEQYQAPLLADARAKADAAKQEAAQPTWETQARERNRVRDGAIAHLSRELSNMADLRAEENRGDEAERLYREALEIRESLAGPDSLLLSSFSLRLADFYVNRKKDDAGALKQYRYAAEVWKKAIGPEKRYRYIDYIVAGEGQYYPVQPADYIESLHGMALIHAKRKEYDAARLRYREAEEYYDGVVRSGSMPLRDFVAFNSAYVTVAGDYAALLRKMGDSGAVQAEKKAAKLKQKVDRAARGEEVEYYPYANCPGETNEADGFVAWGTRPESRP